MTLHGCCSLSSVAHSRSASSASVRLRSLLSREDLFLPSHGTGQSMCALVLRGVCKSWMSGHSPADPPTCGFMTSARIASSCVTRPRFELGHSSRAPSVSAKRVRLSCSLKSRFFFVHASRCTKRWPVHATHVVVTLCTSGHHA